MLTPEIVKAALAEVKDPVQSRSLYELELVRGLAVMGGNVRVTLDLFPEVRSEPEAPGDASFRSEVGTRVRGIGTESGPALARVHRKLHMTGMRQTPIT